MELDSVAPPEHAAPEHAAPEHAAPEHAAPEHAPREQAATGDAQVDEALARLDDLDGRPVDEHPVVFEHVHRDLTAALGTLDSRTEGTSGISGAHDNSVTPIPPGS